MYLDETARYEPSHRDLRCLQMYLFLFAGLRRNADRLRAVTKF